MFLAFREIRHARLRFFLIAVMIVLVSSLVFIISGLANGLRTGNTAALLDLPVDRLVMSADADGHLDRSTVSASDAEAIRGIEGVTLAEPIGMSQTNVRRDAESEMVGTSLFGIQPDGVAMPRITDGTSFTESTAENPVVADASLKDDGIQLGDTIAITPGDTTLTVVGFTSDKTFRLSPVIFMPFDLWQSIQPRQAGLPDDPATAILVKGDGAAFTAIPNQVKSVTVETLDDSAGLLPGVSAQDSTLLMIQVFLIVIAAGIIAAFFYIITLQKTGELGVMKALGTRTGYIGRALVIQAAVMTVIGVVIGGLLAIGVGMVMGTGAPFNLTTDRMLMVSVILLVVAVLGSGLSLNRIARIDPLDAINRVV